MKPYLIFIVLAISCTPKKMPDQVTTTQISNDFQDFVETLPIIRLPYEMYCEDCCGRLDYNYNDTRLQKYLPNGSSLIGVVFKNPHYIGILVSYPSDMIIPAVVIYDVSGRKIDEKSFLTHWCGRDVDLDGRQHFIIHDDATFSEIDTTYTFALDSTNAIFDTLKTEISRKDFKVDNSGKLQVK